jgi:hypothetical protein
MGRVVALLPANTNLAARIVAPAKIWTVEATNYYGETMVVTGKVVQVTVRPDIAFLYFDKPSPDSPFTAVMFEEALGQFGDLQNLTNRNVEISGTVTEYRDKPEIILESVSQIKLVGSK